MADPISIAFGPVGLFDVGTKAVEFSHSLLDKYHNAETQVAHARAQRHILEHNVRQSKLSRSCSLSASQPFLESIEKEFAAGIRSDRKRDRLQWALKDSKKVAELIRRLKETETSAALEILLQAMPILETLLSYSQEQESRELEISQKIAAIQRAMEAKNEELLELQKSIASLQSSLDSNNLERVDVFTCLNWLRIRGPGSATLAPSSPRKRNPSTQELETAVTRRLGIKATLVASEVDGKTRYTLLVRWPLGWKVLNGRFAGSWPSWGAPSITHCFRVQNMIPTDSEIVKACSNGEDSTVEKLLLANRARPNDTTENNLTLLCYATRSGSEKTVQKLLDSGADANLCYGKWETSPLDTAMLYGHHDIVRLLLKADADLEYVNRRTWTAPRYIFDPNLSKRDPSILLDICASAEFRDWNLPDIVGWTILHRAAAFGQGRDVTRLIHLGASTNAQIAVMNRLPIQCAAKYGNLSTFNALADRIPSRNLVELTDSRGWTLLHLAAQTRSLDLLVNLLRRGFHPSTRTSASSLSVPEGLDGMEATPQEIAKASGTEDIYLQALDLAAKNQN